MIPDITGQVATPPTMPFSDQLPIVAVIFFIVCVFAIAAWTVGRYVWSEVKASQAEQRKFQAEQNKEQRDVLGQITKDLTQAQRETNGAVAELAKEFRSVGTALVVMNTKMDTLLDQTKPYNGDERRQKPRGGGAVWGGM